MLGIHREDVPAGRRPRECAIEYEGEIFPCKLLVSSGNFYPVGEELLWDDLLELEKTAPTIFLGSIITAKPEEEKILEIEIL